MSQNIWPKTRSQQSRTQQNAQNAQNLPCPYILARKLLGTGSYANVYECKNSNGVHLAAKKFEKKRVYGNESMLQREFLVLKKISRSHPNILSMIDYFETADYFYLVTDLAAGGELFERVTSSPQGKLSVGETSKILKVLLSAVDFLHQNSIVHRDIKSENILFTSKSSRIDSLLLADFGQAAVLSPGQTLHSLEGTLSYLAPDVLSKQPCGYSFPVDMWAIGVLTYFMLCGYMPFDCDTEAETKELICKADYVFEPEEYWCDVPECAKNFISECFLLDPQVRLTARNALEHPFVEMSSLQSRPALNRSFCNAPFASSTFSVPPIASPSAPSSTSLQRLHDAVLKLQHMQQLGIPNRLTRQSSSNTSLSGQGSSTNLLMRPRLSASSMSSTSSFEDRKLQGEKCYTPDTVTAFTTPVTSASVSRQASFIGPDSLKQDLGMSGKTLSNPRRIGQAKFSV